MGHFSDMPDSNLAALNAYEAATDRSIRKWEAAEDEYGDEALEQLVDEVLTSDPKAVMQLDEMLCQYVDDLDVGDWFTVLADLFAWSQTKDIEANRRAIKAVTEFVRDTIQERFADQVTDRIAELSGEYE